jgi:hypothetical protein
MLEDEFSKKKTDITVSQKDYNLDLVEFTDLRLVRKEIAKKTNAVRSSHTSSTKSELSWRGESKNHTLNN